MRLLNRSRTHAVAVVSLTACGLLLLDGCTQATPDATPHTTKHSSKPSPTPSTTALPADLMDAQNAPDLATFNKLSQAERLAYCSYETRDMNEIAQGWKDTTKNKVDTLPVLNGNNTPQELLQAAGYGLRAPWLAHQGGDVVYDKLTADKVLSCTLGNLSSNFAQRTFAALDKAYDDKQAGQSIGMYAQMDVLQIPTATGTPETSIVDGNPTVTTDVIFPGGGKDIAVLTTVKGLNYEKKPTYFVTIDYKS